MTISRRNLLASAGGLSAAALLAACGSDGSTGGGTGSDESTGALNIYSWADYFAKENLDGFAKQSGITPKVSTYDNNDTLYAKLNSAARANYDLVVPSSGWVKVYQEQGLIQKISDSGVDLSGIDPDLLSRDYDPDNEYSLPKDWGVYGVIYDPSVTGEIQTWDDFFAAGLRDDVVGKIRLGLSGWETVGMKMWAGGIDWNTTDVSAIEQAGEDLKEWTEKAKPAFTAFDVDQVVNGSIVLAAYNQAGARTAIQQNPKLKWVVPGPTSELWVDSYVVPEGAKNVKSAYEFLTYEFTEDAQIADTAYLGYPTALKDLRDKLPADTEDVDLIFGGEGVDLGRLQTFVVNTDTLPTFQNIQAELQALG